MTVIRLILKTTQASRRGTQRCGSVSNHSVGLSLPIFRLNRDEKLVLSFAKYHLRVSSMGDYYLSLLREKNGV